MSVFFPGSNGSTTLTNSKTASDVMVEVACETDDTCDNDQYSYKGLAAQWLGATTQIARFTNNTISSYLRNSAAGAAQSCSGGSNHTTCGTQWTTSTFDGNSGLGQQLSALNVIVANLAMNSTAPATMNTTTIQQSGIPPATPKTTGTTSKSSSGSSRLVPFCMVVWIILVTAIAGEWLL